MSTQSSQTFSLFFLKKIKDSLLVELSPNKRLEMFLNGLPRIKALGQKGGPTKFFLEFFDIMGVELSKEI